MRYVYAHFPINVNIEKNSETGLFEVDIRYVDNGVVATVVALIEQADRDTEISLARRSFEGLPCNQVLTLRHRRTRRMNYNFTETRSRTYRKVPQTSSRYVGCEIKIFGR